MNHEIVVSIHVAGFSHAAVQARVLAAIEPHFQDRLGPIEVRASREHGIQRQLDAMTEERNAYQAEVEGLKRERDAALVEAKRLRDARRHAPRPGSSAFADGCAADLERRRLPPPNPSGVQG